MLDRISLESSEQRAQRDPRMAGSVTGGWEKPVTEEMLPLDQSLQGAEGAAQGV